MLNKTIIILFITLNFFTNSYSQDFSEFYEREDSLVSGFNELFANDGTKFTLVDSVKIKINDQLVQYFNETLNLEESYAYPFDSVKQIGIVYSQDHLLRIITWNIKFDDGTYKYFGFIQHYNKKKKKFDLWQLNDDSANMQEPLELSLFHNYWYGCLYFQIVDIKNNGNKIYTLIGWDGNNYLSKKKIVDVLYFTKNGDPRFGKKIFNMKDPNDKTKYKRLIFEYSAEIVMFIKYEERYNKIVLDHLTPYPKEMVNKREFYYNDGSYDALSYNGSKWIYIPEFWATNTKEDERQKGSDNLEIKRSDKLYKPK